MGHAVSCNDGDGRNGRDDGRNGRDDGRSEFENARDAGINIQSISSTGDDIPDDGISEGNGIMSDSDYASYSDYVDVFYDVKEEMSDCASYSDDGTSVSDDDWEEATTK